MMARAPGALLVHPAHLVAMAVLGLNDHWLKAAWPGPVTGKLSDIAGLVVLPIVVVGSVELVRGQPMRWPAVAVVSIVTALGFAAVEIWAPATRGYAVGLGWIQWVLTGAHGVAPTVDVTMDTTDLFTLPAAVIPVVLAATTHVDRYRRRVPRGGGQGEAVR